MCLAHSFNHAYSWGFSSAMGNPLIRLLDSSGIDLLFDDPSLLVLNKPSGLLVLPDRYDRSLPDLYTMLKKHFGKVYVVHRIEKDTSGVILFPKTAEAHKALNTQFEKQQVEKVYEAIVTGTPRQKEDTISLPLSTDRRGVVKVDQRRGKEAITDYIVKEEFSGYALVGARPRTGRQHQIRVHLQAIGLPILSDQLYGDGRPFYLSDAKPHYRAKGEEKPLLERAALHAAALSFDHPTTGERVSFSALLPKGTSTVLKYLRKFRPLPDAD